MCDHSYQPISSQKVERLLVIGQSTFEKPKTEKKKVGKQMRIKKIKLKTKREFRKKKIFLKN